MDADFSIINHMYLSKARNMSIKNPVAAAAVLGIPLELTTKLATMSLEDLSQLIHLKPPLFVQRNNPDWWGNLFDAACSGSKEAVEASIQHGLLTAFS